MVLRVKKNPKQLVNVEKQHSPSPSRSEVSGQEMQNDTSGVTQIIIINLKINFKNNKNIVEEP